MKRLITLLFASFSITATAQITTITPGTGAPEFSLKNVNNEEGEIYYRIVTEYGSNIDPIAGKVLVFVLTNDSSVKSFRVDSWMR